MMIYIHSWAGHESIGYLSYNESDKIGQNKLFALMPHGNCITQGVTDNCKMCKSENLCLLMVHAGLSNNAPGGFAEQMYVNPNQLFPMDGIEKDLTIFLEPLSCVIRGWKRIKPQKEIKVGIVGAGPIGLLHYLYRSVYAKESQYYLYENNMKRVETVKKILKGFNLKINIKEKCDIVVMACSTNNGFERCKELVKSGGKIMLFSGFNNIDYRENGWLPEFVHREEFVFSHNNVTYVGTSGYTHENFKESKSVLKETNIFKKLVTGIVNGLDSKKVISKYWDDEEYKKPVILCDIHGALDHHIKLHYIVNKQ